jgi:hypothetical protein
MRHAGACTSARARATRTASCPCRRRRRTCLAQRRAPAPRPRFSPPQQQARHRCPAVALRTRSEAPDRAPETSVSTGMPMLRGRHDHRTDPRAPVIPNLAAREAVVVSPPRREPFPGFRFPRARVRARPELGYHRLLRPSRQPYSPQWRATTAARERSPSASEPPLSRPRISFFYPPNRHDTGLVHQAVR